jgi:hypothetical protein
MLHSVTTRLADLEAALDAVVDVDLGALDCDEIRAGLLALHRVAERLRVVEASWLAEAERATIWCSTGARSAADWLATSTGTAIGRANDLLRLADAIDASPALAGAVADGRVSTDTAVAVHGVVVAPPDGTDTDDVERFVDCLTLATPRQARDAADRFRERHRPADDAAAALERVRQLRSVTSRSNGDGTVVTTLVLPTLESRQFHHAIQHAAGDPFDGDDRTTEQRLADGATRLAAAYATCSVGGGRERATVLVTITAEALAGSSEEPGRTDHGDVVPAEAVRRLAESAVVHRLVHAGSTVLDLGRGTRFASDEQYRALVARDRGCRWRSCTMPARWCEIDHLVPWQHGGATDLDNLVLWCNHHHHVKHRPDVHLCGTADDLVVTLPDGTQFRTRPPGLGRAPAA